MICMNSSGCLSKSTMNLNKHLQINTKAQKLLRFDLLMTCYDLIMDFGWGSMDGRWPIGLSKLQLPMVCCADIRTRKASFFPLQAIEVIKAAYKLESTLPHGPRVVGVEGCRWRGDGEGASHIQLVVDSDPVPGLDELLSKIAKDEQVWYQTVSKSQQGNHMIDEEQTKLQMKLRYLL